MSEVCDLVINIDEGKDLNCCFVQFRDLQIEININCQLCSLSLAWAKEMETDFTNNFVTNQSTNKREYLVKPHPVINAFVIHGNIRMLDWTN